MVSLWWNGPTARGMFLRKTTGLRCPGCQQKLIVVQWPVVLLGTAMMVSGTILLAEFGMLLEREGASQNVAWGIAILGIILLTITHFRVCPRFAKVRLMKEGEQAAFPLDRARASNPSLERP